MKTLIKNIGQIAGIVEEGVLRKEGAAMSETEHARQRMASD